MENSPGSITDKRWGLDMWSSQRSARDGMAVEEFIRMTLIVDTVEARRDMWRQGILIIVIMIGGCVRSRQKNYDLIKS